MVRKTARKKEYWEFLDDIVGLSTKIKTNQSYLAISRALHREMYKGKETL